VDRSKQAPAGKEQKARFAAVLVASVLAITLLTPVETHSQHPSYYIMTAAILPAAIAWLIIRERPERQELAVFRGVSVVLALVGLGGLGLFLAAGHLSGFVAETVLSGRFRIQAGAYFVAGLLGLGGSVLFAPDD
jgi:glucan phosphoethanolaminetransferase (alkaline phosphatase superfamily)